MAGWGAMPKMMPTAAETPTARVMASGVKTGVILARRPATVA
jgi:hypothetical protein